MGSYTTEELGPPTYKVTANKITATRRQRLTSWSDVNDYIDELFASGVETGSMPWRPAFTTLPGHDHLVLQSVDVKPFTEKVDANDSDGLATCGGGAELTLQYSTLDYQDDEDDQNQDDPTTWLSHSVDGSQQVLTHGQSSMKWASDDAQVHPDIAPGFPITIVTHNLTWHAVPNPPLATWYGLLGKCNAATFLTHHGPETVLFSALNATKTTKTDGTRTYEAKMTFLARVIHGTVVDGDDAGWNHFLRPDGANAGKWERILKQNDEKPIPTGDFTTLFSY